MIKHYCDGCGKLASRNCVTERFTPKMKLNGKTVVLSVMVSIDGLWNAGDLCMDCIKKVFTQGKEA